MFPVFLRVFLTDVPCLPALLGACPYLELSSYGSVVKAIHKESGRAVAIKQVPVEGDLQEIVKEIGMMQQCDWPHVVQYYGSYFKNSELWIVMEFCGAGSVADIMRLRRRTVSMAIVNSVTLLGFD